MIDEARLRDALVRAGDHVAPPVEGPARVLAAARTTPTTREARHPTRWRTRLLVASPLAVIVIVVIAATLLPGPGATTKFSGVGNSIGDVDALGAATGAHRAPIASVAPVVRGSGGVGAAAGAASTGAAISPPSDGSGALPAVQTRVVKTGSIEVEIRRGSFGHAVDDLRGLAVGLGGFVSDSKTFESADVPNGTLTLRVPAANFEALLARVRSEGKVRSVTTSGQDVTGQYTDLEARIDALTAARDQLVGLLRAAKSIPDILAVQDRVTQTQSQLDQLQGQLKVLDDQSSFGTLAVTIAEPGRVATQPEPVHHGWRGAWHDAVHGFVSGAEAILAHTGTALLVLFALAIAGALAKALYVTARRRML